MDQNGREALLGKRVVFDPSQVLTGKGRLGARVGTIIGFDERSQGWPIVRLDRIGRERKQREVSAYPFWLIPATPELEGKARAFLAERLAG